jgi:two-component system alkaline phosphatase synthesis response regulator PhoP
MPAKRVLIIEDEREIAELLEIHLKDLECHVEKAADGLKGLQLAQKSRFDLVVLDLMLPKMDGLEVCRKLRTEQHYTPILMLTAKSEELDKVLGLETGADDYLTKPFSIREFIARVKAIFRRMEALAEQNLRGTGANEIACGGLVIDREKRKVTLAGKKIELTPKEFDLLVLFATHPGRAYSREELLNTVWGYQFDGYDHTVNSHINRLRMKIEKDVTQPRYIQTVWGVGYRFSEEEEHPRQ